MKLNNRTRDAATDTVQEDLRDLGFGTRVSQHSRLRLLNRDGSFNVARSGLSFFESLNLYQSLLSMSWPRFHLTVFATYLTVNFLFALGYLLSGAGALNGTTATTMPERFLECFFFSIQTFTTVGYGHLSPNNLAANFLVMAEAFVGVFAVALSTGLLFARFSRPTAKILFSNSAIIAPYRERTALEFRIANLRSSQLIEVEVKVMLTWIREPEGRRLRQYRLLTLERNKVSFFPLHWTVVHPIDEDSPLFDIGEEELRYMEAEVMILITGIDDTFSQMVHARTSYRYDEIVWGAKFVDIFRSDDESMVHVDLRRLHQFDRVPLEEEFKVQN